MKITDKYVLFWGGEFSQWAKCSFKDSNDVKYSSTEQFMMAHKALVFNDIEMYDKIMSISNVKTIKAFGRQVKNFDKKTWDDIAKDIVYLGNYYKFTQNEEFQNSILKHKNREFVEASPKDNIWGIGLHETDPKALDKNQWEGTNWLGECLTEVKDDLFNDSLDRYNNKLNKLNSLLNSIDKNLENSLDR